MAGVAGGGRDGRHHGVAGHQQTRGNRGLGGSAMLFALLAALGVVLLAVGLYLPRTGKDVVAERLAAFNQRSRSLEEIELQQPFTERVLRPFIRQLADALSRFQQARSKNANKETQIKGMEAVQRKLALAGNPYRWTPADFLGVKAVA